MHVKIIRHSERFDFKYPIRWLFSIGHYWADPPLTVAGREMSVKRAKEIVDSDPSINYKYIITSPYLRTVTTSTEFLSVMPNSTIVIEPLLAEYQPYYAHSIELYPDGLPTNYNKENTNFIYPESYEQFCKRVEFIISRLLQKYEEEHSNIIIVTHGEILKCFISQLNEKSEELKLNDTDVPYLTMIDFESVKGQIIKNSIKIINDKVDFN